MRRTFKTNCYEVMYAFAMLAAGVLSGCSSIDTYSVAPPQALPTVRGISPSGRPPRRDTSQPVTTNEAKPTASNRQPVKTVQYIPDPTEPDTPNKGQDEEANELIPIASEEMPLPGAHLSRDAAMPIDLPTALRLAGGNHLQIALATERIQEAAARLDQASVLWVPSLNLGVGYNRHDGQIQDTAGNILDVSRQSLYAGGGALVGSAPLSGGAGGPARMFVDLSLADAYFQPLVARQNVRAVQFERNTTFNDSLLQVGLTYQELVRAHMQVEIAEEAAEHAAELARITRNFAQAGTGLDADALRALAEFEQRQREVSVSQERVRVVSAELARLLRLDPTVTLTAVDPQPLPLQLVSEKEPLAELFAQGLMRRPELAQHQARVDETLQQIRQEDWRPWLPHLFVGYAGASFGGGAGSDFDNFGGRGDLDALAVWELKNLGLGNRAMQRERESQHRQAHLRYEWLRDQVIAQIVQAHVRSVYRKEQIEHAKRQVQAAAEALPLNFAGIRDGELRPIEAQQAITGLAAARSLYLGAVIDYNQAQLELLRAIGEPPNEEGVLLNSSAPTEQ